MLTYGVGAESRTEKSPVDLSAGLFLFKVENSMISVSNAGAGIGIEAQAGTTAKAQGMATAGGAGTTGTVVETGLKL